MIKGPFSAANLFKLAFFCALLFSLSSLANAQIYPDFYHPYNYSISNQAYTDFIPTQPNLNYPLSPANNYAVQLHTLSSLYALSSLYMRYGAYPFDISRYPNVNTLRIPENNGFAGPDLYYSSANNYTAAAASNISRYPNVNIFRLPENNGFARPNLYYAASNNYTIAAASNVTGTWVGRFAKTFSRNSNSWGNNGGSGGSEYDKVTYPINLNLTQYEDLVSGIAALSENNVTTTVNVDGSLSGTQVSLVGFFPNNEALRFRTNASIQGDTIRGSYTITDISALSTVETGSFNVTKQGI